jgi:PAS domain S-box-containing protein
MKRIRNGLQSERNRLRYVLEGTNAGTWEWNIQTGEMVFNERWAEIIGYTLAEISPVSIETWRKSCHPDDLKEAERWLREYLEGRSDFYQYECRMCHKSGEWVWVFGRGKIVTWTVDGRPEWMCGTLQDISERKRHEQALLEEQALFAAGPVGIITRSPGPHWPITFVSENISRILGYTPEEMLAPDFRYAALIHPDDLERVTLEVKQLLESGRERFEQHYRLRCKSGEYRWFSDFTRPIRDHDGKIINILGYMFDDTERVRAESERGRLLSAIEQAGECIVITDSEGTIQYVNPAFVRITGYRREEALGQNPRILKSGEHDEVFYEEMWHTLTSAKTWRGRFINKRRDGSLYTEDATISPVLDDAGRITSYVAVKRDVTAHVQLALEKARLEDQYRQAQKVESIGRLAGGVAHDLNNLLTPIIGYGELLLHDAALDEGRRDMVEAILAAGFRARDLVRQLLAFSRKQTLELKALDINKVISGFEKLLRRTIPEDIELKLFLASDALTVMADGGQIEQVLMNLATNAADAMPNGGRMTIETARADLDEKYAVEHLAVKPGPYALLAVSDSGVGMDDKTRKQIFEPFFSTKGKAGTGLGLATVYGIVKQHGGNIWVYSEPGRGATFKVYLPLIRTETASPEESAAATIAADLSGSETILLVEDNEEVRELSLAILQRQGYTVITAENGRDALAVLERHEGPLHLLLTDVVMPGMNGRELFDRAVERRPGLKALFMSGYTNNVIAHRGVLDQGVAFIQKPFSIRALATKVREVLAR